MNEHQTSLPDEIVKGYWQAVGQRLQSHHGLTLMASRLAISNFRSTLAKLDIGDIIYHDPIEETAQGIVVGGYADAGSTTSSISSDGSLATT